MTDNTRRQLLLIPLAALLLAMQPLGALADDGDSDGGSDSGGSGSDDGGSNSGPGGGDDSDDDNDDDDDGGNDDSPSSGGQSGASRDQDRARDAVRRGKAVSLKALKQHLASNYPGKVLKIELKRRSGDLIYKVRILDARGRLRTLRLDARTLARSKS